MAEPITFIGSFPAIGSAIQIDGQSGMRIIIDIPESEMANAIGLLALRQQTIQVTIEAHEQEKIGTGTVSRTKTKRRKRQGDPSS
jgi:hypothetical protein